MTRITVVDKYDNFSGWFSKEASKEIASYKKKAGLYINGLILLTTKKGKLIINEWNNSGMDIYRFATDEKEIASILAENCEEEELTENLKHILDKYEI